MGGRVEPARLEVALLAARGLSNKDVARELDVAEQTIKQLHKLGAPSRYNLILWMKATNFQAQGERG